MPSAPAPPVAVFGVSFLLQHTMMTIAVMTIIAMTTPMMKGRIDPELDTG